MSKGEIGCPYHLAKFKDHKSIKSELLQSIKDTEKGSQLTHIKNTVSKCDYDWSQDTERPYLNILLPRLQNHLNAAIKEIGFSKYNILNIWYQQYVYNDIHDWHVHSTCNFTCVYYLEFPKNSPQTEYIQPVTLDKIEEFKVKEGDILIFPSLVLHRGKRNKNNKRKTIISWNLDVNEADDYPEDYLQ